MFPSATTGPILPFRTACEECGYLLFVSFRTSDARFRIAVADMGGQCECRRGQGSRMAPSGIRNRRRLLRNSEVRVEACARRRWGGQAAARPLVPGPCDDEAGS